MAHQPITGQRKPRKPPRQKHVPVRTCVSCREPGAKRGLTRIVRTPEGEVVVDPTGKKNGRGAYVCEKLECWRLAIDTPVLARALKTDVSPGSVERLKVYSATLRETVEDEQRPAPMEGIIG